MLELYMNLSLGPLDGLVINNKEVKTKAAV